MKSMNAKQPAVLNESEIDMVFGGTRSNCCYSEKFNDELLTTYPRKPIELPGAPKPKKK